MNHTVTRILLELFHAINKIATLRISSAMSEDQTKIKLRDHDCTIYPSDINTSTMNVLRMIDQIIYFSWFSLVWVHQQVQVP